MLWFLLIVVCLHLGVQDVTVAFASRIGGGGGVGAAKEGADCDEFCSPGFCCRGVMGNSCCPEPCCPPDLSAFAKVCVAGKEMPPDAFTLCSQQTQMCCSNVGYVCHKGDAEIPFCWMTTASQNNTVTVRREHVTPSERATAKASEKLPLLGQQEEKASPIILDRRHDDEKNADNSNIGNNNASAAGVDFWRGFFQECLGGKILSATCAGALELMGTSVVEEGEALVQVFSKLEGTMYTTCPESTSSVYTSIRDALVGLKFVFKDLGRIGGSCAELEQPVGKLLAIIALPESEIIIVCRGLFKIVSVWSEARIGVEDVERGDMFGLGGQVVKIIREIVPGGAAICPGHTMH